MDVFLEMRAAVAGWLALTRPDANVGSLVIGFSGFSRPIAVLPVDPAPVRPTDATATRRRCLEAVRTFVAAAYPDADYMSVVVSGQGRPTSMLFFSGPSGPDPAVEESHRSDDFNTTDKFPVNPDGTLGKRRTARADPRLARDCRRTARWYARQRERGREV
jgi:hypothetical protein